MSTEFKGALEREIAELEKSLEADPRFIKLRELQRVANLYQPSDQSSAFSMYLKAPPIPPMYLGKAAAHPGMWRVSAVEGRGEITPVVDGQRRLQAINRARVLEDAENILRGRTEPTKTADLYDALIASGHEIGGDDPKNNLSAMLSKSPLFRSHKRAGWTLVESQSTAPDDDSDGSDDQETSYDDMLG